MEGLGSSMPMADCLHKVLSRTSSYIIFGSLAVCKVMNMSAFDIKARFEFCSLILIKYVCN